MDNRGIHNFVQLNAGERMCLQTMVTSRSCQGAGGSPEEASWEWMSDSHTPWSAGVERRKRVKRYVQESGRGKRVLIAAAEDRTALFLEPQYSLSSILVPVLLLIEEYEIQESIFFLDNTLRKRWFRRSGECYALGLE
ncbi:hypothetical protein Tco_0221168 [Tanacetum coccineum]|uniref:Uncharacterized protein n=1 Tax=Tanacetum coccineum TaxID=301880 RepID=A0ABQ4WED2_9ASTR